MKQNKLGLFIIFLLSIIFHFKIMSQSVPQGVNYQGIALNASSVAIANQAISVKIGIYAPTASGTLEWEELHNLSTNQFGLFNLVIGQGASTGSGAISSFAGINWGANSHYFIISIDETGGSLYVAIDTMQFWSVPYALYSNKSNSIDQPLRLDQLIDVDTLGVSNGYLLKWNGSVWTPAPDNNSDTALYASNSVNSWNVSGNTGTSVLSNFIGTTDNTDLAFRTNNLERMRITSSGKLGIGTSTPTASLHVVGNDGVIAEGTFGIGATPPTGTGTRMVWYPKKAAFRAGGVLANNWDDVYIGNYSFASGYNTRASGAYSTSFGSSSLATGAYSLAAGDQSQATAQSTVAMGSVCYAQAPYAVALGRSALASDTGSVAIGYTITSSGYNSLAFGAYTTASGDYSVAMGWHASTNGKRGSFVFADGSSVSVTNSTVDNQFLVRASGGVLFYSNTALTSGVSLAAGAGAWSTVSDRNKKEHFKSVNANDILAKISEVEITTWNYKSQPSSIKHIGPMAQDFYKAFNLGESDTTITTVDMDGVSLIAIQALSIKTNELKLKAEEVDKLKAQIELLENDKKKLEKRILSIEKQLNIQTPFTVSIIPNK